MNLQEFSQRLIPLSTGATGLRTTMHVQVREPGKDAVPSVPDNHQPVLEFISSDESLDRYGEIISAAGWKLENYQRNPVFQNAHQHGDILHTLGRALVTELRTISPSTINSQPSTALFQRIEFACDVNPMARIAYGLYRGQFLNAVSVGFVPIRWQDGHVAAGVSPAVEGGILPPGSGLSTLNHQLSTNSPRRIFLEQELLEVSAVAIPANPNALALGLKSGAVEKSDLKEVVELFRSALAAPKSNEGGSSSSSIYPSQLLRMLRDLQSMLRS